MKTKNQRQQAFTLTELLVVVGIIAVMAAVFIGALSGNNVGTRLASAQGTSVSMMRACRSQATLQRTRARVIIHNSSADEEKYHRYIGIVYEGEDIDNPGGPLVWFAANEGEYFPDSIYFNVELSDVEGRTMTIEYPRDQGVSEGSGEEWYYYEYKSTGQSANPGARFVIGSGKKTDVDSPLIFDEDQITGFMVHKLGSLSIARDPDDLKQEQ